MDTGTVLKRIFSVVFVVTVIVLYGNFNPNEYIFFPKCPFLYFTNLQCPGCGSQRALHYILNLDIHNAARENILLVLSLPYIFTGLVFELRKESSDKILQWRKRLFGQNAIFIVLAILIAFWIMRNLIFLGSN